MSRTRILAGWSWVWLTESGYIELLFMPRYWTLYVKRKAASNTLSIGLGPFVLGINHMLSYKANRGDK
jgi:hypothetical protein